VSTSRRFLVAAMLAAVALSSTACASRCPCPCPPPCTPVSATAAPPAVVVVAAPVARVAPGGPADWDALLAKRVQGDYVDYAGWKADPADMARLRAFLDWQATADPKTMSRENAIAFWINAYNSSNIATVLEYYPVHSPMDISGYFDKIRHRVAGEDLTVSQIEYDHLIAGYQDMRAHFAVVCSDRGCLPIRAGAWKGETLDADLDAAAKRFAHDPRHFKADPAKKEIQISKIFEWYGPKFTKDPKRPVEKAELFLLPYVDADAKALLESGDYTVKIIEWNWTINEKRTP
jgi:hypothetical protein